MVCPYSLNKCDFCGKCALFCPNDAREICGKKYAVDEVLLEIMKDKDYYGATGGVTFSGGECMLQIEFLTEILKKCKKNGIHTAVDTAGNLPWEEFEKILPYTDLFLYDVKCFSKELHKDGTGVANTLILDNLEKLSKTGKEIIVRVPVIPELNGNEKEMQSIAKFVKRIGLSKVELLPYHAMGEYKWGAIGKPVQNYSVPTKDEIDAYKAFFNQ